MLGKLARWLRLLGVDAAYGKDLSDNILIEKAQKERRILLTSDEDLLRNALSSGVEACLIDVEPIHRKIGLLAERYGISLEFDPNASRCPRCGEPLREASKEKVESEIPPRSYERYDEYWICPNNTCKKIYWRGSHWRNISATLKKSAELVAERNDEARSKPRRGEISGQTGSREHQGVA